MPRVGAGLAGRVGARPALVEDEIVKTGRLDPSDLPKPGPQPGQLGLRRLGAAALGLRALMLGIRVLVLELLKGRDQAALGIVEADPGGLHGPIDSLPED